MFLNILRLDDELNAWRSWLPQSLAKPSEEGYFFIPGSDVSFSKMSCSFLYTINMCFFALKAQLHALPAFVGSFLHGVGDQSLLLKVTYSPQIAYESAREIFNFSMANNKCFKRIQTSIRLFCLSTAHQTLFYYSLMYPSNNHIENDLKLIDSSPLLEDSTVSDFDPFSEVEKKVLHQFSRDMAHLDIPSNIRGGSRRGEPTIEGGPARVEPDIYGGQSVDLLPWIDLEAGWLENMSAI